MSRKFDLSGTPPPIKEARCSINPANLQEVLDASAYPKLAVMAGQSQFETPEPLARLFLMQLPSKSPEIAFDPQCASGRLLEHFSHSTTKLGFELDQRYRDATDYVRRVIGNCVAAYDAMDEMFPDLRFDSQVANPPFGLQWKLGENNKVDSTEYTWQKLLERTARGGFGYMIGSRKTIERLNIHNHEWVYLHQVFPVGVFKNVEVEIGVVHWLRNEPGDPRPPKETVVHTPEDLRSILFYKGAFDNAFHKVNDRNNRAALSRIHWFFQESGVPPYYDQVEGGTAAEAFKVVQEALDEERRKKSEFNFWLDDSGRLKCYLSTRTKVKRKLKPGEIARLSSVNGAHPLTLTTDKASRRLLEELVDEKFYTIQPEARAAMESALEACERLATPLMPVTDFSSVAYADEEEQLRCHAAEHDLAFTPGKSYRITTGFYRFTQTFTRRKVHFNPQTQLTYTLPHECSLSGQDRYIEVEDDNKVKHRFMERPDQISDVDKAHVWNTVFHEETWLWDVFDRPKVRTVLETHGKVYEKNIKTLKSLEMAGDFQYYSGQITYLARLGVKDSGICAADTGTGKSLFALSLIQMKQARRALIVAPQGTVRSSDDEDDDADSAMSSAQWIAEIRKYAPGRAVYEIFSLTDYLAIKRANGGTLPDGAIFVSYWEALYSNGALETASQTWEDPQLEQRLSEILQLTPEDRKRYGRLLKKATLEEVEKLGEVRAKRKWCDRLGREENGIRCIALPCLSTLISHEFDFVAIDECQRSCHLETNTTQMMIRMQPKYRWLFSATCLPDNVSNMFPLMGWVTTLGWYRGDVRSAAWPFAREEIGRFEGSFRTEERDHTQEALNDEANKGTNKRSSKCIRKSPVISSPARLLKLVTPTMAHISKVACNPNYTDARLVDIRVPLGLEQSKLYGYFLDRGHIRCDNPLIRARKQIAYLRNVCADPAGFKHGGPSVSSNFNPKTVAILELVREMVRRGEQFVIINARIGQSDTLQTLLTEAGISLSRIDSTTGADKQSAQANKFKREDTMGMLMGLKSAAAFSFERVPNLIVGSLEYSPGPLNQAKGRIDRVNSTVPRTIYCVLHEDSIEQLQFDTVAQKDDAVQIILQGRRVPRNYKPIDMSEVLADSIVRFNGTDQTFQDEQQLVKKWPEILASFKRTA